MDMENIDNFASLLKKQTSKKPLRLYSTAETQNKTKTGPFSCSAKDVLLNVSKQIKAIQSADVACSKRTEILNKHKKREFLTVDMIPVHKEVHQNRASKFETQCVSDTQLIDIIESAEIIDKHRGVTQEFDTSFCQKSDETDIGGNKKILDSKITDENLHSRDNVVLNEGNANSCNMLVNKDDTCEMDTLTCIQCDNNYMNDETSPRDDQIIKIDDHKKNYNDGCTSPILNACRMSPPLVYSLYTFEKFENLALPIIEEHTDLQTAKNVINSQIIDSELFIPNHVYKNNDKQTHVCKNIENNADKNASIPDKKETPNSPEIFDLVENDYLITTQPKVDRRTEFKDEILFSSDEEDEYLHKEVQELPLTCALETSFYEKSDVFDKHMYVGFQTASNKSIQINTDSFTKAKSILSTVVIEETSIQDLVEIFDTGREKSGKLPKSNLSNEVNKDNSSNSGKVIILENANNKDTVDRNEAGYKVGEEIGDNFKNESLIPLERVTENNDDILMSQVIPFKSIATAKHNRSVCDIFEESIVNTKRKFEGFKTASNKRIKLSDKALARCKKVFQDIDFEENFDDAEIKTDPNHKDVTIEIQERDNINVSQDIFEKKTNFSVKDVIDEKPEHRKEDINEKNDPCKENDEHLQIDDLDFLQDFEEIDVPFEKTSTAVLENSVYKATDIFHDILVTPEESGNSNNVINEDEKLFKKPKVSEKVLSKPKKLLRNIKAHDAQNLNAVDPDKPSTNKFITFKTAANKEIKITPQTMEKIKNFYKDIDNDLDTNVNCKNYKMVEEKNPYDVTNTEDSFAEELLLNEDIFKDSIIESIAPKSPVFKGFQTANNKDIIISEKALKISKKLFEDITNTDAFHSDWNKAKVQKPNEEVIKDINKQNERTLKQKESTPFSTAKDLQDLTMNKKQLKISNTESSNIQNETKIFVGFQTASNKQVKVSDKDLANSKKIFQDINLSQTTEKLAFETSKDPAVEGFNENNETSKFIGFKTASCKPVSISADALAKSKKIFKDFEDINNCDDSGTKDGTDPVPIKFVGFKTASNKEVKISKLALDTCKHFFNEVEFNRDDFDEKPVAGNIVGFKTASDKEVKVSQQALDKYNRIFNDLEVNNDNINNKSPENNYTGFKTGSNKKVQISDDALAKSRRMLNDFDFQNDDSIDKPESNKFVGFKAASNKIIKISEESLAKSKAIFKDINNDVSNAEVKNKGIFKGFQTANNTQVKISEKSLEKSKKLFQDLNVCGNVEDGTIRNKEVKTFYGFQTASNKKVNISDKALAMSKKVFEGIEMSQKETPVPDQFNVFEHRLEENADNTGKIFAGFLTASEKKVGPLNTKAIFNEDLDDLPISGVIIPDVKKTDKDKKVTDTVNKNKKATEQNYDKANINKDIIDTQVLNDFQDTLNTEDFCKDTPKSKRSGSPILSCPRAKKRRFETPYRVDKKIQPVNVFVPPKITNSYRFKDDYKKNKMYNLKDLQKLESDAKVDTDPYVTRFNFENLDNFEFFDSRNDISVGKFDVGQIKKLFLDSVDRKIVPDGWVDNHVKLIIWKLLSYEIKFPSVMKNVCTVRNVMDQLKYRYDKELYKVQRPILRKILEKDDVPSKTMVLCVAAVYVNNTSVVGVPTSPNNIELLLTDGWYCVRAVIDRMLSELVCKGSIVVGCKIANSGAELINCEQGIAPWEDTSSVRLKLHGNSTRRARWLSPLGARAGRVTCGLRARPGGGRGAGAALLARAYPRLCVLRGDGGAVILSEKLEQIRQTQLEAAQQALMEKLYEELETELDDQESQDSLSFTDDRTNCLESGSQISRMIKQSRDPDEYRSHLTGSQNALLEEHDRRKRERRIEEIRVKFQEKSEKSGVRKENVAHLLKVRLVDFDEKGGSVQVNKGFLSIWNPSAAVTEMMTEGAWVEISNFIPTGIRNSEIQLSAGRQTIFKPYVQKNEKYKLYANTLKRKCYQIKELAQNPTMTTDYDEIDTVGMIFQIEPSTTEFEGKKQNFQNVFLADADKSMICVNFWGGLKKFGFENVLDTGQTVTCVNLQKRAGNSRKSIPQYRATEFSCFTKTPKDKRALELTSELTAKLSKAKERFCEDCTVLKNNYTIFKTRNVDNVSPYRFSPYNMPKKLESPMNCDANLNLTGLDFESSFTTQMSPEQLLRKKRVKEKIERLKMYGEPPPLSSIHIINQSKNASATYKSPLLPKDNIASDEKSPINATSVGKENFQNDTSPVGLNRTFVKRVNPVKLNFSNNIDNDLNDSVDHFAEDFEASPPLSLDSDVVL